MSPVSCFTRIVYSCWRSSQFCAADLTTLGRSLCRLFIGVVTMFIFVQSWHCHPTSLTLRKVLRRGVAACTGVRVMSTCANDCSLAKCLLILVQFIGMCRGYDDIWNLVLFVCGIVCGAKQLPQSAVPRRDLGIVAFMLSKDSARGNIARDAFSVSSVGNRKRSYTGHRKRSLVPQGIVVFSPFFRMASQ